MTREEFQALPDIERDIVAILIGTAVSFSASRGLSPMRIRELFAHALTFDAMWDGVAAMVQPLGKAIAPDGEIGSAILTSYHLHKEQRRS